VNSTYLFGKLRSLLAPPMRVALEYCPPLRALGLKMLEMRLKPTVNVNGHTVHINPRDFGIAFELQSTGEYEGKTMELCIGSLQPGMTFVDVGAHVGLYTLEAARKVGPTGRVYSFEPDPGNFELLSKNVKENGYTNVTLVNKAVSDADGTLTLYRSNFNTGDHRTYFVAKARKGVEIGTVALDRFFANLHAKVDVVKIDIEGAEEKALKGMHHVLQTPGLKLFIECCPDFLRQAGTDPLALLKGLEAHFHLSVIDDATHSLKPADAEAILKICKDKSYANVLCVRK
jgi:FkbM family methyltransferase